MCRGLYRLNSTVLSCRLNALNCISTPRSAVKLFHTRGPATEKLLSPKVLWVRGRKHFPSANSNKTQGLPKLTKAERCYHISVACNSVSVSFCQSCDANPNNAPSCAMNRLTSASGSCLHAGSITRALPDVSLFTDITLEGSYKRSTDCHHWNTKQTSLENVFRPLWQQKPYIFSGTV